MIYIELINSDLKAMEDRIEADALLNSRVRLQFKLRQQILFLMIMKAIYNLIGESNKSVNIIDWCAQISMQHADGTAERSAVSLSSDLTAFLADIVKEADHVTKFGRSVFVKLKKEIPSGKILLH